MTLPIDSLSTLLSSFGLVAISEMGDKTQLLAFALAVRFKKPWAIMGGILIATILNHGLASWGGYWVSSHLPPLVLRLVLALIFIVFGVWILVPDKDEIGSNVGRWGAFVSSAGAFFLAEMGDKTQLATVALGARFGSYGLVTIGTTLGMLFSDGLAVFLGDKYSHKISMVWVRRGASVLFVAFGLWILLAGV
jgi:putative Ca2+/H+ antiporter (TMEM165/GDT1 family)